MRAPIFLIALAVTACSQAPAQQQSVSQKLEAEAAEHYRRVQAGLELTAEEARARDHRIAQKQAEVAELAAETCRRQPYLDRCR